LVWMGGGSSKVTNADGGYPFPLGTHRKLTTPTPEVHEFRARDGMPLRLHRIPPGLQHSIGYVFFFFFFFFLSYILRQCGIYFFYPIAQHPFWLDFQTPLPFLIITICICTS
jgi:hypothetical protein